MNCSNMTTSCGLSVFPGLSMGVAKSLMRVLIEEVDVLFPHPSGQTIRMVAEASVPKPTPTTAPSVEMW